MTQLLDSLGRSKQTSGVPRGVIAWFSGSTIPVGWALCVTGDTLVTKADGTHERIDALVERRATDAVLTFSPDTGSVEAHQIVDWFEKPIDRDQWLRLNVSKGSGFGPRSLTVTRDHPVWIVGRGWVRAQDIVDGDQVLRYEEGLTVVGRQAVTGMMLGDGSMEANGVFSVRHGEPQRTYITHIGDRLDASVSTRIQSAGYGAGRPVISVKRGLRTVDPDMVSAFARQRKVRPETLAMLGPVGLAYWYMDDGSMKEDRRAVVPTRRAQLHTEGFAAEEVELILTWLWSSFGIKASAYSRNNTPGRFVRMNGDGSEVFWRMVAPYVHPSMRYKLPEYLRTCPHLLADEPWLVKKPVPFFVSVRPLLEYGPSKRNLRIFDKCYDIKVAGNASFIANSFIVHNCDGTLGTPDLRGLFIIGDTAVGAGSAGGTVAITAGLTHAGMAVAAHGSHGITQAAAHGSHAIGQAAAHGSHAVTQPSAHADHSSAGAHTHEAHGTAAATAGATQVIADNFTHSSDGAHAHDAHSAHTGANADAHSAHASANLDAHSAHASANLDAHSAHGVTQPDTHGVILHYELAAMMSTG